MFVCVFLFVCFPLRNNFKRIILDVPSFETNGSTASGIVWYDMSIKDTLRRRQLKIVLVIKSGGLQQV